MISKNIALKPQIDGAATAAIYLVATPAGMTKGDIQVGIPLEPEADLRHSLPDGDVQAVAELRRVAETHADSKNAPRHLLELADLYVDLATEYVEKHPPEGLLFDPAEFQDLVDSAARVYEMVAARDGTPERLEASRRLEAFLAFSITIDRQRFTP